MCLSVTLLTVPTPTECVFCRPEGAFLFRAEAHALIICRLKAYFHRFDESLSLWSNAVDLDSLEHALMEVITFLLGPVSGDWVACSAASVSSSPRLPTPRTSTWI